MYRIHASLVLCCATSLLAPLAATAVNIDTVPVGNPGNAGEVQPDGTFGGVAYGYRIGTTEVTNAQYAEFLNAKAGSDPLHLYRAFMDSDPRGGITVSGSDPNLSYAVKTDMGNKPVSFVSWYDSIRFANWLNNGQGTGDTETGAYTLLHEGSLSPLPTPSNGLSIARNPGATWFLTSENEWYKAAYHQPAAQGGDGDDYWLYPTASNNVPTIATSNSVGDISNPGTNVINYLNGADWNSQTGNVTTVGSAGLLSESFYGTSDQGGNVWEWNEALLGGSLRGLRGGSFPDNSSSLLSSAQGNIGPEWESFQYYVGFRVASVPEPSTLVLAALGLAVGLLGWKRRKGH